MKRISALIIIMVVALSVISCSKKEMNINEFFTIENEFLTSDLSETAKEDIAKKYGYTAAQYNAFEEKVNSDQVLKTKLGELRLKASNK